MTLAISVPGDFFVHTIKYVHSLDKYSEFSLHLKRTFDSINCDWAIQKSNITTEL